LIPGWRQSIGGLAGAAPDIPPPPVRFARDAGSTVRLMATTTRPVEPTAPKPARRLPWVLEIYRTGVGKKYAMAITGVIGMGFIVGHMVGNLKLFLQKGALDHYGEWLRYIGYPALPHTVFLWILRSVLIVALAVHVHAAWSLTQMNKKANVGYASERDYIAANFASRTMRWTGIIITLFVLWHLADLTWGTVNAVGTDGTFVRGDVYNNVVRSFNRVPVAILYVVANIALGIHLFHGVWSLFQSMGWNNPRFNKWRRHIATGIATIVVVGNVSFPVAVLAGIVG
jgi:succinate dehydrogenase / fumarate reductase cytochrome b subunit